MSGGAAAAEDGSSNAPPIDLVTLRRQLRAFRPPFVAPPRFASELRASVASGETRFTDLGDLEIAISLYEGCFAHAFETFVAAHGEGRRSDMVFYKDVGWGDEEAETLAEALAYAAEKCDLSSVARLSLNFRENEFTAEGKALLEKAVAGSKKLAVRVHVVGEPEVAHL